MRRISSLPRRQRRQRADADGLSVEGEAIGDFRHEEYAAPGDFAHRLEQQIGVVVLGHIALGAGLDGAGGEDRIVVHAEDDDSRSRVFEQDAARQFEAGNAGHCYIDDRDVGPVREEGGEAGLRVARVDDLDIALARQHRRTARNDDGMIVDDENAHFSSATLEIDPGRDIRKVRQGGRKAPMLQDLSLRARLSLLLGGITVAGLAFGVGLLILHAGARVNAEAEAATRLARDLVQATLPRLQSGPEARQELADLLADSRRLRHVHVTLEGEGPPPRAPVSPAPDWFSALVFRSPEPIRIATPQGVIEIASNPSDEIAEIWEEIVWLAVGAAGVAGLAFALVSYAVSRTLRPVGLISDALHRLEQGDYAVRAPADGPPEFVAIANRLNSLAATLQRLDDENHQLVRRMIHRAGRGAARHCPRSAR